MNDNNQNDQMKRETTSVLLEEEFLESFYDDALFCPVSTFYGQGIYSLFMSLVLRFLPKTVATPMADGGYWESIIEWLNRTKGRKIRHWGDGLRSEFDLSAQEIPRGPYDFVWLDVPYWYVVGHGAKSAGPYSYEAFVLKLWKWLFHSFESLRDGGRLAVTVGDLIRQGRYIPLLSDVLTFGNSWGEVSSIIVTARPVATRQFTTERYGDEDGLPIGHAYCVLFRKRPAATESKGEDTTLSTGGTTK
jgi:hypothetical protein